MATLLLTTQIKYLIGQHFQSKLCNKYAGSVGKASDRLSQRLVVCLLIPFAHTSLAPCKWAIKILKKGRKQHFDGKIMVQNMQFTFHTSIKSHQNSFSSIKNGS